MLFNRFYGKKIAVFIILVFVLSVFTSCSIRKKNTGINNTEVAAREEPAYSMTGVVTNVDTDLKQVTIREIDCDVDTILDYNATAVITDKYGEEITGDKLEPGQIMEVTYNTEKQTVINMGVPDDVWEYQDVKKFTFNGDEGSLNFAGKKYQYTSRTYYTSLDSKIQMMELDSNDVITVRGIGIKVYSVTRTQGHGYIRLVNYKPFIGGTVSVGSSIFLPVSGNMLITASEGSYRVILSRNGTKAIKNVIVKEDSETKVDFSEYKEETSNIGSIQFKIEPYGADLYINNTSVDYSNPVALDYGEYNIRVEMTGYTTYTGVLDVEKADSEVKIDLIEKDASVSGEVSSAPAATGNNSDDNSNNEPGNDDNDDSDDDVTTKKIDSNHTITVSSPEGAEVYLDNVYKGLAPCTFTKVIGSQTVTLSKEGYVTKSYSIDVLDDDKNVKLGFSELVEDAG